MAVAASHERHVLEAVVRARRSGLVEPILVGDEWKTRTILASLGEDSSTYAIEGASDDASAIARAIELVRTGSAQILMKGIVQTRDFMRGVVARETGLRTGRLISSIAVFEVPGYPRLLSVTDMGINVMPDLSAKVQILENSVELLHGLGIEVPKVAALSAAEKVNPKILGSEDAAEIARLQCEGKITGCEVAGPISLDLATNPEACVVKGYSGSVTGNADLILVPDLVSGNALGKSLMIFAHGTVAGLVLGASAPIVMSSRSASVNDKFNSIVLATAAARHRLQAV